MGCKPSGSERGKQIDLSARYAVDVASLERIRPGVTFAQARKILGDKGRHQFTVPHSTSEVMCVAYFVEHPYARFYALFRDQNFQGFVEPPSHEVEVVDYGDATLEIDKPLDIHKQTAKVGSSLL